MTGATTDVKLYSTAWCGHCRRLKRELDEAGITFTEVDLDERPELGERIVAVTGGDRTVPAVEIDGHVLVNPTLRQVEEALPS